MIDLDQKRVRRLLAQTAASFEQADFFHREILGRLLEQLELISLEPAAVLNLASRGVRSASALASRYPKARIIAVDRVPEMLTTTDATALCADAGQLPLNDGSVDLVFSNLALHWFNAFDQVFAEVNRVLRSPGLFSFTTLGPASLAEIRNAWSGIDDFSHVHEFCDMHKLGDALIASGFSEPVMNTETITVTYTNHRKLIGDLRAVAATNSSAARNPGLTGRGAWEKMLAAYSRLRDSADRFPVSIEVIYGQAWAGTPMLGAGMHRGEASFALSRLRIRRPE